MLKPSARSPLKEEERNGKERQRGRARETEREGSKRRRGALAVNQRMDLPRLLSKGSELRQEGADARETRKERERESDRAEGGGRVKGVVRHSLLLRESSSCGKDL